MKRYVLISASDARLIARALVCFEAHHEALAYPEHEAILRARARLMLMLTTTIAPDDREVRSQIRQAVATASRRIELPVSMCRCHRAVE